MESRASKAIRTVFNIIFFAAFLLAAIYLLYNSINDSTNNSSIQSQSTDIYTIAENITADDSTLATPYYRSLLNEAAQVDYDSILECLMGMSDSAEITSLSNQDSLMQVFEFVMYDHPEIFWVGNSYKYDHHSDGTIYSFTPSYTMDSSEREYKQTLIDSVVGEIASQLSEEDSDYIKALRVYEYLAANITYDDEAEDSQNIVSSLINGVSACAGYSRAYQYILNQLGIPCIYVSGVATNSSGETLSHAWNIMCIDGILTQVDITWGDSVDDDSNAYATFIVNYAYFCLPDSVMYESHTPTYADLLPECTSSALLYSVLVGSYYDVYDEEVVYERLYDGFCQGEESIYLQFSSSEGYSECESALLDASLIFEAANAASSEVGISKDYIKQCNIYRSENMNCVVVTIDLDGDGVID